MTADIQYTEDNIAIVTLPDRLDSHTYQGIRDDILPIIKENISILLDMTSVKYMSSAGLRMLLVVYRAVNDQSGKMILVGVTQRLQDVMSMTGFLTHFLFADTIDDGINALET